MFSTVSKHFLRIRDWFGDRNIRGRETFLSRGFTLVELLVSIGIFLIILSIVLIKYRSFDSSVLMRSLAYDVAASVREARTLALSVLQSDSSTFRASYGISFTPGQDQYVLFDYLNVSNPNARPKYDTSGGAQTNIVKIFRLGRSFRVAEVCVLVSGNPQCGGITRLDVSFTRPDYLAIFHAEGYGGSQTNIEGAIIRISSDAGSGYGRIEIGYSGYVAVTLE